MRNWLSGLRRVKVGGPMMTKLRPQVLAVIVVLGAGAIYLVNQGSTGEGATVLGVTAGIATKLIESQE
jgi:hypothetical protein